MSTKAREIVSYANNVSERTGQSMGKYRFVLIPDWSTGCRRDYDRSGFYQEGENYRDALERLQARRPSPAGMRYLSADR
jgi:hypothetical protein